MDLFFNFVNFRHRSQVNEGAPTAPLLFSFRKLHIDNSEILPLEQGNAAAVS